MFGYVFEKDENEVIAINLDKVVKIRVYHPSDDEKSRGHHDYIKFEFEHSELNEAVCFGSKEECEEAFISLVPIWKKHLLEKIAYKK